jgi:hypothetical protein
MKSPLARVAVIGACVHDRVMREDVDVGEASGISDPIRALKISGSRPDIASSATAIVRRADSLQLAEPSQHFFEWAGNPHDVPAM